MMLSVRTAGADVPGRARGNSQPPRSPQPRAWVGTALCFWVLGSLVRSYPNSPGVWLEGSLGDQAWL